MIIWEHDFQLPRVGMILEHFLGNDIWVWHFCHLKDCMMTKGIIIWTCYFSYPWGRHDDGGILGMIIWMHIFSYLNGGIMLVGQPVRLLGVWRVCPKLVFSHFPVTMEVWQNTTGAGEGCDFWRSCWQTTSGKLKH